jgi:hypothetical protein
MKVIVETAVVSEQRDALIAENSALKVKNLKMKIQKKKGIM